MCKRSRSRRGSYAGTSCSCGSGLTACSGPSLDREETVAGGLGWIWIWAETLSGLRFAGWLRFAGCGFGFGLQVVVRVTAVVLGLAYVDWG